MGLYNNHERMLVKGDTEAVFQAKVLRVAELSGDRML